MVNTVVIDKRQLTAPLQLMLKILADDRRVRWNDHAELFAGMDWEAFIKLARHHRVYPYLYTRLKDIGHDLVPLPVLRGFYQEYCNNTFIMLGLCGEMERICKHFDEAHIRPLLLKGPVLAADLYGDISQRTSCDLDILIPIRDLLHAEAGLLELGYIKDDYIDTVLNDWKWRHHHTTFKHPRTGIKVELHWRLNPAPSKEPAFEELWSRRRRSPLSSYPLFYLGREDLFLFLVTHGARHG
ncbi:nucleotidyltransferase family protein, partial [Paenibacillus sepulcri]|nr:nucleotidyltransferase family protein [Paenibacillus sepulcri]